jgi:hypothetical protein
MPLEKKTLKSFGIESPEDLPCEKADIQAIKAVVRGDAVPEQQRRAMDWIIKHACNFYGISQQTENKMFPHETPEKTSHNEGRRFVGWLLVNLSNMRLISRQEESREQG